MHPGGQLLVKGDLLAFGKESSRLAQPLAEFIGACQLPAPRRFQFAEQLIVRIDGLLPVDRPLVELEDGLHGIAEQATRQQLCHRLHQFVLLVRAILILVDIHPAVGALDDVLHKWPIEHGGARSVQLRPILSSGVVLLPLRRLWKVQAGTQCPTRDGVDLVSRRRYPQQLHLLSDCVHPGIGMRQNQLPPATCLHCPCDQMRLPIAGRGDDVALASEVGQHLGQALIHCQPRYGTGSASSRSHFSETRRPQKPERRLRPTARHW